MEIVYATATSMVATPGGGQIRVDKGSHWPATDPIVLAQPSLFSADARYGLNYTAEPEGFDQPVRQATVEQATAAPGERRSARRG